MADQFENKEEIKVEEATAPDTTAHKRVDQVAEKAAEKVAKTVQHFDKENGNKFNK
jgi:hypothetical protein